MQNMNVFRDQQAACLHLFLLPAHVQWSQYLDLLMHCMISSLLLSKLLDSEPSIRPEFRAIFWRAPYATEWLPVTATLPFLVRASRRINMYEIGTTLFRTCKGCYYTLSMRSEGFTASGIVGVGDSKAKSGYMNRLHAMSLARQLHHAVHAPALRWRLRFPFQCRRHLTDAFAWSRLRRRRRFGAGGIVGKLETHDQCCTPKTSHSHE